MEQVIARTKLKEIHIMFLQLQSVLKNAVPGFLVILLYREYTEQISYVAVIGISSA
jgi:hypothetical protein